MAVQSHVILNHINERDNMPGKELYKSCIGSNSKKFRDNCKASVYYITLEDYLWSFNFWTYPLNLEANNELNAEYILNSIFF